VNPKNFFGELKRRNVYKVAVAYAIVGWLSIQIATQVFPFLEIPNWVVRLVIVLVAIGFPIALVIAWAFESTPEGIKPTEAADAAGKRSRGGAWIYIVLIGMALSVGLFLLGRYTSRSGSATVNAIPHQSIAVLPFANMSADKNDEYLSDGVSEELISTLSKITALQVKARTSSFAFKGKNEDIQKIGELLRVSHLLEGSVARVGNKLRITAQLIQATDGNHVWSDTYDREMQDIFAIRTEVARKVADALKIRLLGEDKKQLDKKPTENIEAHNAYLLGHYYFQRRNLEDYAKAIGYFDEAIRLDPEYAVVYAERSEAWTLRGDLAGEGKTMWPKAVADAEKAVALAPELAEAHAALGWVRFFAEWKFDEGLRELKRAKELSPYNPTANDLLARVVVYVGELAEAEKYARQAVESDPLAATAQFNLGRILFAEGKLDEAEAAGRKVAELQPTAASAHRWQVFVAIKRGDGETALREAQLEPDPGFRRQLLALAHVVRGDRNAADAALADLSNRAGLRCPRGERQNFRMVTIRPE
jgi:TolB-like protein/Tfp pilus assembly protein PilF